MSETMSDAASVQAVNPSTEESETVNQNDLLARVARLTAELEQVVAENKNLRAKADRPATTGIKMSEKGAVSVYGIQRFPITLYQDQWPKLFAMKDEILSFIEKYGRNGQNMLAEKPPKLGRPSEEDKAADKHFGH